MLFLRSLLFMLLQMLLIVVFSVVAIPARLFAPLPRYRIMTLWASLVILLARHILGIRHRVIGLEHVAAGQPAVILAKHQSAWETIAFQQIFPPISFVLKKELLRIPFFGWGLATINPIAIDRKAGLEALKQIAEQGARRLKQGFWVLIFPEGTRVQAGEQGKYQIGGAWLATRTGTPVIPVAHNAGRLWPRHAFIKRPGEITVVIGPPIATAGRKAAAVNAEAEAWIETEMRRL